MAIALAASVQALEPQPQPSVAFFYGKPVPVPELSHFDWVVVEPDNVDARTLQELQSAGVEVFAYLSLGETLRDAADPSWVIGKNAGWGSVILDPSAEGWQDRVRARATALWKQGYRGLFLDTLDSFMAALREPAQQRTAAAGLARLIRALHDDHPEVKLFFNRGFEILDDVGNLANGMAAESLFAGWNAGTKTFVEVSAPDREWLSTKLRGVRERFGIPVVAIDYLPPARRAAAPDVARRIQELGFVPWVSNPPLDMLGTGSIAVVPRRLLLLYDGAEAKGLAGSRVHSLVALPAEHLGFAPDYVDVRQGLPQERLAGRYAGIVTWFGSDSLPPATGYPEWLFRQIDDGVRVVVLGQLGFRPSAVQLGRLGLAEVGAGADDPRVRRIALRDAMVGLEAEPTLRSRGLVRLRATSPDAKVHLRLEDSAGRSLDAILTMPWGALALDPYVLDAGYQGRVRWILDPFAFLERALDITPGPVLDLTTEGGARLLLVTADAEGASRSVGSPPTTAAEVVLRDVLRTIPVATTVAVPLRDLESREGTAGGATAAGRAIGEILALPNVEAASHSYSHPAQWSALSEVDQRREVEGSIELLTAHVPPGRRPVRTFVWPGDGPPGHDTLARVRQKGLASLSNGTGQSGPPSLASLSPSGRPVGGLFQAYLPGLDERTADELAAGRVFDRAHVAALANLAETPRRLGPVGIHYPFWLVSTPSAVHGLQDALRWTLEQRVLPLWASAYVGKVEGFRHATVARRADGAYCFRDLGGLRTVRFPRTLGWPDLARSPGVASVTEIRDSIYVTFAVRSAPGQCPVLVLSRESPRGPFLTWTNARVEAWTAAGQGVSLRLVGHGPVRLDVGGASQRCSLTANGQVLLPTSVGELQRFEVPGADTGDATLDCRG